MKKITFFILALFISVSVFSQTRSVKRSNAIPLRSKTENSSINSMTNIIENSYQIIDIKNELKKQKTVSSVKVRNNANFNNNRSILAIEDSLYLCNKDSLLGGVGYNGPGEWTCMIKLPSAMLTPFIGKAVFAVAVGIADAASTTSIVAQLVTDSASFTGSNPAVSGTPVTSLVNGWNNAPVEMLITGSDLWVGYHIVATAGFPSQTDGQPNVAGGDLLVDGTWMALSDIPITGNWSIMLLVGTADGCVTPNSLSASNLTSSSADLSWNTGGATAWNIEYGTAGFTQGTGTTVAVTTNPYTLSGLTPGDYEFYVQDDCGATQSAWNGPSAFTIANCAVFACNFTFQMVDTYGDGWNGGANLVVKEDGITLATLTGPTVDTLVTTVGVCGTGTLELIWNSGTWDSEINFKVTDGDGQVVYEIIDPATAATLVDGAVFYTGSSACPTCPRPTTLAASNITTTSADITWVEAGSATLWDVEYGAQGFTATGTPTTAGLTAETIALTGLTDNTSYDFYVRADCGGSDYSAWVGPFTFTTVANCLQPTTLAASNIAGTTADITWVEAGTATLWDIEYGVQGFTPTGTPTTAGLTAQTASLTGLTAQTAYDIYVRADCGGSQSSWTGPVSFTTACAIAVAPYTQDFENAGAIPNCWEQAIDDDFEWSFTNTTTPSANTGPSADHTTGTGYYAFVESSSPNYPTLAAGLITPTIDITPLTNPALMFWYNMNGADMGSLNVDVYDGTWHTDVFSISGNQGDVWTKVIVDISAYTSPVQIKFRAITGTAWLSDAAIDDVSIEEGPSCFDPTALAAQNATMTSADLSWTSSATTFNVEYGAPGFTQGTGTAVNGVTANPYTLTGLTAGTPYEFYVQADCGGGNSSAWVGPIAFGTLSCLVSEQCDYTIVVEDSWGDGWNGAYITVLQNGVEYATITAADGGATSTAVPTVDTLTFSVCDVFDLDFVWTSGAYDSEASFSVFYPWGGSVLTVADASTLIDGVFATVVSMCTPPACPAVTNLSAGTITTTSAILSWTNGGSETAWNVEYGISGYTQGTGTTVAVTTNPYSLTGLVASTAYDFYVQADCGGSQSIWAGPFSFATACNIFTTFPWNESFEGGVVPPTCWSSLDVDGDTYNWEPVVDTDGYLIQDGSYAAMSASWDATAGILTPDNYLITPQFTINANNLEFKYWVGTQDGAYPAEEYSVLVSTTGTATGDFTQIYNEILTADDTIWREVKLPLAAYDGQNIYLAFRHFNSSDNFQMKIDNVSIDYTTSINTVESNNISIYPNPTTGIVNIKSAENSNVFVYNILGDIVASFNNISNNSKVDLSNLSEGNYVIKVVSDKESVNQQITIVK